MFFWYQMHFSQPLNQVSHMQIFASANCADGVVTDRYVNYLDTTGRVISSKNDGADGKKTALAAVADIACAQSRYRN
ncbi:hypothetical protein [Geitlerinema sp. PCC 7407]|uniref:hypothetical protein n=1 Tax=Geitlerinema sp. PCC 7407 TaxID=1173025 RepID=UPI0002EAE2DF|nr:hypothetical protein [Geitlerinema sp. PCC 7407]